MKLCNTWCVCRGCTPPPWKSSEEFHTFTTDETAEIKDREISPVNSIYNQAIIYVIKELIHEKC